MKKKITTINEEARAALGITRDEYALCSYIQYRQADKRGKRGWCIDPKEAIADFVGITRMGLYKMIARMTSEGLIEQDAAGALAVSTKWLDAENDCKLSLQPDVNKVYTGRKLSLHGDVNKVYAHNKVEYDYKYEQQEQVRAKKEAEVGVGVSVSLEALPPSPPVPAAPPSPGPAIDAARAVEIVRANPRVPEIMQLSRRVPADLFDRYLGLWELEIKGRGITYWKQSDAVGHFLNFAASKHRHEKKEAPAQASPQRLSNDDVYRNFNRVQF